VPSPVEVSEALTSSSSRLKRRSLPSAYLESVRLYYTNLGRYLPAIAVPAFILFLVEASKPVEYWLDHPNGAGLLPLLLNGAVVTLLSGVLGHLTSHIYAGGKTGTWETLVSALKLVPAGFAAAMIPALGAALLVFLLPGLHDSSGNFNGWIVLLFIIMLWAVSIVASVVVESEGVRNPLRAVWRSGQLISAKDHKIRNSLRIVGVVLLNVLLLKLMTSSPGVALLLKLTVEPVFEIVYGLLYFNLRFDEGGFDVSVLAKQLEAGSSVAAQL